MTDHETLVAALRAWNRTQDSDWRAAGDLVIDHGRWLRDPLFREQCIGNDDGTVFILWYRVGELLERRELIGTHSEIAVLRWAALLVGDQLGARSLDRTNREALLNAVATALGVTR